MNNHCLIKQPAGIGDIFSVQKIVHYYLSCGYTVTYPVLPQLLYIKDYLVYEGLNFVSTDSNFNHKDIFLSSQNTPIQLEDGTHYIPLEHASQTIPGCVIRAKYNLIGIDWQDWRDYFIFNRNIDRENSLFYDVLKLSDNTKYNFINNIFGTLPGSFIHHGVRSTNNLQDINVSYIEGYTVFDWCKVLENASGIYTVDTSFLFIIEKLNLKTEELQMWSRGGTYTSIDGLFNKKWKYN